MVGRGVGLWGEIGSRWMGGGRRGEGYKGKGGRWQGIRGEWGGGVIGLYKKEGVEGAVREEG